VAKQDKEPEPRSQYQRAMDIQKRVLSTPPDPNLDTFVATIERTSTPEGERWRAMVKRTRPDGAVIEHATPWQPRDRFYADWALCNRRLIDFLFDGMRRPMVG
jgi:hypothetical protein